LKEYPMQAKENSIPLVRICGAANKRTGKPCQNKPMPNGRCRMHGGKTPIKHGLYSKAAPVYLKERIDRFLDDPRLGDMNQQLALTVSLIDELLERLKKADYRLDNETRFLLFKFIDLATKITERKAKLGALFSFTPEQLKELIEKLGAVVRRHVKDQDTLSAIANDLRQLTGSNNE